MGETVTYREIFSRGEFRALFLSRTLSTLGDYVARAALVIAVFTRTQSTALLGVTFALTALPDLIGGPVLAGLADRFPRRAVMVIADLGRAGLLVAMAIPGSPLWALWVFLVAIRLLDPPFNSAYIATMSVVLPGQRLVKGSAVTQVVNHLSYAVGYALGGMIVAYLGLSVVLLLNSVTFTASALIIMAGIRARPAPNLPDEKPKSWWHSTATATRYIWGHPRLRLIMMFPFAVAMTLVCETLATPYAQQIQHGPFVAGLLMAASCAGVVLGLWVFPILIPVQRAAHLTVLAVASCATLVVFWFEPGAVLGCVVFALSGATLYFWIPLAAEFTQTVPDAMRGQSIGLLTTVMRVTQAVAILLFGFAAQHFASSTVIAAAGVCGAVVVALLCTAWARTPEPVSS